MGISAAGWLLYGWRNQGRAAIVGVFFGFVVLGGICLARWHWNLFYQFWLKSLPITAERVYGRVIDARKTEKRWRIDVRVDSIKINQHTQSAQGKIRITLSNTSPPPVPSTAIELIGVRLQHPLPPRNPGMFNYQFYLHTHSIVAVGTADTLKENRKAPGHVLYPVFALREYWVQQIEQHFPAQQAGFLRALLVGDRTQLPPEIRRHFQLTGMMHVLAISGLHVGLVSVLVFNLLKLLGLSIRWRYWGMMGVLISYALLTGAQPPVVRATVMLVLWSIARLISRHTAPLNLLFAAALMLLLFSPNQLFWAGFQLSFTAVLFILVGVQWFSQFQWVRQWQTGSSWQRRLLQYGIYPVVVTLWAQLGTLPFIVTYFHMVSPIAILLNLVVLPAITLLLYLGLLFLIVVSFSEGAAIGVAVMIQWLLQKLFQLVAWASQVPLGHWRVDTGGAVFFAISLGTLIMGGVSSRRWRIIGGYIVAGGLLAMTLVTQLQRPETHVVAMDVGQGDALLISTPHRSVILVDTGPPRDHGYSPIQGLGATFRYMGIHHIHRLLISHPHLDHMGNLREILRMVQVDSVYFPHLPFAYRWQDSLQQWLQNATVPYRAVEAGDVIPVDGSSRLYILAPIPSDPPFDKGVPVTGRRLNNHSMVARLWINGATLLLPGDVERESEYRLMVWKDWLKADILKVPHHGSQTSTVLPWMQLISPQWSLISVGRNNRFGHPSPRVIQRLKRAGSRVLQTTNGAIWLFYSKNRWQLKHWQPVDRFCQAFQ